jgi:hypothetical protein
MSYDYLRLYTNAFAFQATVRRLLKWKYDRRHGTHNGHTSNPSIRTSTANTNVDNNSAEDGADNNTAASDPSFVQAPSRIFYNNVGATPDVRFIYEGLDAAKAILSTANNFVDPEKMLRFMPLRVFLYLVYAGVFLYRARCVGVLGPDEDVGIRKMIKETIGRLQRSSVGPLHPGSRYSELLKLLWAKLPRDSNGVRDTTSRLNEVSSNHTPNPALAQSQSQSQSQAHGHNHTHAHLNGRSHHHATHPQHPHILDTPPSHHLPTQPSTHLTPSTSTLSPIDSTDALPDFAWTDLMAVGDFAMGHTNPPSTSGFSNILLGGGHDGGILADDGAFWSGFLPFDMGNSGWDLGGGPGGGMGGYGHGGGGGSGYGVEGIGGLHF